MYSNSNVNVTISNGDKSYGKVLADFRPEQGKFVASESTTSGQQLRALSTRMRGQYNILKEKLSVSGFNHSNEELIFAAYERCGAYLRAKDAALFYYWYLLHDKDVKFINATLEIDEQAVNVDHDDEDNDGAPAIDESSYKKRKRLMQEQSDKAVMKLETDRLTILKNVMFPNSPSVEGTNTELSESKIAMNHAATKEKLENAIFIATKTKSEQINSLLAIIGNQVVFHLYDENERTEMLARLKQLSR